MRKRLLNPHAIFLWAAWLEHATNYFPKPVPTDKFTDCYSMDLPFPCTLWSQPADPVSMVGRGPPLAHHHFRAHNLAPDGPTRTNRHTNTNRTMSPQNYRSPIRQKTCWVFVWRILLLAELVSRNFLRIIKGCVLWNTTILASLLPRYHNHCAWL